MRVIYEALKNTKAAKVAVKPCWRP
jgi:hypothetical protein